MGRVPQNPGFGSLNVEECVELINIRRVVQPIFKDPIHHYFAGILGIHCYDDMTSEYDMLKLKLTFAL